MRPLLADSEPRPNYGATPRERPRMARKPAIAAILTLFLAASSVALQVQLDRAARQLVRAVRGAVHVVPGRGELVPK